MKKMLTFALLLGLSLALAACGAAKSDIATGNTLVKEGKCAEAAQYLDNTIKDPAQITDLGLAYYLKAKCAEEADDLATAYAGYYATKIVACYSVAHDTSVNLNTYGRTEFCENILPKKLEALAPKVGTDKVNEIRAKVDKHLEDRYLEQFYKK
ncbi:MAG: hypothetical protein V3571_15200 [Pseudodesulfovibrio sp.]